MNNRPTSDDIQQMQALKDEGKTYTEIGTETGFSRHTVRRYLTNQRSIDTSLPAQHQENYSYEENGDKAELRITSDKPIKTLKELEASCEVDFSKWRVAKWGTRAWTVPMKTGTVQSYSVFADFVRLQPKSIQDASDAIFERMLKHAPKYINLPKLTRPKNNADGYLGVLSITDVHWGKLAWGPETGEGYDLKIVERIYRNAIDDLIAEAISKPIERWLFVAGSDFYHVDNAKNTTFNNTPQDVDGRYAKMIETGEMAVIEAIEKLMAIAPVDIKWCAGNHDQTASYHLARTLHAWFRNTSRVTVDYGATFRKYYHWENTLLGLTHGSEEKMQSLPSIMAQERPKEWAASTCHEWLIGHMHRSRQWQTMPVDTHEGTTIRVMRSLSSSDSWHTKRGYINSPTSRSAELYWYSKKGYAGHSIVNARNE